MNWVIGTFSEWGIGILIILCTLSLLFRLLLSRAEYLSSLAFEYDEESVATICHIGLVHGRTITSGIHEAILQDDKSLTKKNEV
ncbi:hypothetical protein U1Q18_026573 [Sarracenia purpurea var. burkii]